jgi:hypothetical protein
MDPSRRWNEGGTDKGSARRSARYEDLIPGPPVIQRLSTRVAGLALKLSPAVDFTSLPPGHLELISHHGSVVQAVLWMGKLTEESNHDKRTATVLSDDASAWSFTGRPGDVMINPVPEIEHFLKSSPSPPRVHFYELDGAVTRAGLAHAYADQKGLVPLTADGGYLLGAENLPPLAEAPLTAFEVHAIVPFSVERVIHALTEQPEKPGTVEVKCRGNLPGVETDALQRNWSKKVPAAYTVLLFRYQNDTVAAIATRVGK